MSKKLTQEYVKNYFNLFGYKLLSIYKNNSTRLILLEKNSKYLYYTTYASFKETNKSYFVHKSNIFSLYNIKLFIRKNRHKYTDGRIPILKNGQKYKNATANMIWICSNCDNEFSTSFDQISHFHSCPFCSSPPKQIKVGFNDLATTNPEYIKYLNNEKDGIKYFKSSSKIITFKCPQCGNLKNMAINTFDTYGFRCNKCSDNYSIPNKFLINLFSQLSYKFKPEKQFKNSNYRYDLFIQTLKQNFTIEAHGEQHYKEANIFKNSLKEQKRNR